MKNISSTLLVLILMAVLCMPASAHPGGTDSNGGHFDRSTGKYHYHHGYPAHDHYDTDGDGEIDCPYDFIDKSNRGGSGGNSSSGSGSYDYNYYRGYHAGNQHGYEEGYEAGYAAGYEKGLADGKAEAEKEFDAKLEQDRKSTTFGSVLLCALIGIPIGLYLNSVSLGKQRKALRDSYLADMRNYKESVAAQYNIAVIEAVTGKDTASIGIPSDVELQLTCTPTIGNTSPVRPFGDYTVYITKDGSRYHSRYRCSGAVIPKHCFELPSTYMPCKTCASTRPPIPEWYRKLRQSIGGSSE